MPGPIDTANRTSAVVAQRPVDPMAPPLSSVVCRLPKTHLRGIAPVVSSTAAVPAGSANDTS